MAEDAGFRRARFEIEARLRRHDGKYRWFLIRAEPFCESGRDREVVRDQLRHRGPKTGGRRAQASLSSSCRSPEAEQDGRFISDLLADEHHWSEEAFRIFEFDPTTKLTVQMIRDMVHPEDLPWFDSVIARAMSGMDVDFVYRIVTPRGAVKHVRGFAHVMEHIAGRPVVLRRNSGCDGKQDR